ncbi:MAG TPA: hypothetical protein VGB78_03195 [Thermoplasmata archaeon]
MALVLSEVSTLRLHAKAIHEARKTTKKKTCPECGKDIHDPDCALYGKDY